MAVVQAIPETGRTCSATSLFVIRYLTVRSANTVISQVPSNQRQSPADATSLALYALAIPDASLDDMKYTLQMVPVASGVMGGDECGSLTLDSTGWRGVIVGGTVGDALAGDICWR